MSRAAFAGRLVEALHPVTGEQLTGAAAEAETEWELRGPALGKRFALAFRQGRQHQAFDKEEDALPLDLLISEQGASPSLLLGLLLFYSMAGAALFASVQQWEMPTGLYFVLSSVSTVGFGDVVPEDSVVFLMAGGYILLGMALFSLWQVRQIGVKVFKIIEK